MVTENTPPNKRLHILFSIFIFFKFHGRLKEPALRQKRPGRVPQLLWRQKIRGREFARVHAN